MDYTLLYMAKREIVKSFCYLGFELNTKGTFIDAINRLHSKAQRAYMDVRESFSFLYNGTPIKVMVKLFNSMIQSIATYGCKLWGIFGWRKTKLIV